MDVSRKMTQVDLSDVLEFLGPAALEVLGDSAGGVVGVAAVTPGEEGALSFAVARKGDVASRVSESQSAVVLIEPEAAEAVRALGRCAIVVADPRREFARVTERFFVSAAPVGVHPTAWVDPSARIGADCYLGPGATVAAGVTIGDRCHLGSNSVLLEGTVLGDDVRVGPNTTIGYVGFGYAREADGTPVLLPHLGGVVIGDRVEIGANTAIDRGTMDNTVIEADVKIDNLVHIAHNCTVEHGAFVIATAILCGSVQVGPRAWIAPNASVLENVRVGADAVVGLASTVTRDVEDGTTVVGSPARPLNR